MLEILLLIYLCKSLGNILRAKGRSPLLFQIMVVVAWFGGEFVGGFAYGMYLAIVGGEFDLLGYGVALAVAAAGAGFTFLCAYLMPAANVQPSFAGTAYGQPPFDSGPPTSQNPYNPYSDPSNQFPQ